MPHSLYQANEFTLICCKFGMARSYGFTEESYGPLVLL
uniref:Uncharacterized protein n=1 Tax=Arundo donax TaxID=35708 RepID=A0A0A9Q8F5_ARUDO